MQGAKLKNDVIDNHTISWWIDTFFVCYDFDGTVLRFAQWPDGDTYYQQDNYIISIFQVIRKAVMDAVKHEAKKRALQAKQKSRRRR